LTTSAASAPVSVVVDHQRGLRSGELAHQLLGVDCTVAALSRLEVILQRGITLAYLTYGRLRGGRERGAAQVGVDDDASGIDDRAQRWGQIPFQVSARPRDYCGDVRHVRSSSHLAAH